MDVENMSTSSLTMIQAIEALNWSETKETYTKKGIYRVKSLSPVPSVFWNFWKEAQAILEKQGYAMRKHNGIWYALRFYELARPETMQRLVEESRGVDTDARLLVPPGLAYRPFQRQGIKYCIDRLFGQNGMSERDGVLLADQPGLGKSIQFLGIINQDPNMLQTKSLIVCPATLKLNWRNETRRWLLDGFGYSAVVTKDRWPGDLEGASIVITNYDVLHKFAKEIRRTRWDYVCFDEAHYLKNENARRTIFALGGATKMAEQHMVVSSIPAKKIIFLTGTPVENGKAGELINIIEKCDPNGLGANRSKFIDRYQRTDEYLEELQTQMRMRFMVRRLKHEVLKELPPKVRQVIPIDPDECGKEAVIFGEEMRLFKEYQECLKEWAVKTELAKAEGVSYYREVLKAKKASIGMTAGQLARLRKRTALAKVDGVIAQVREIVSDGDPLILFAHHIEVLDRLEEALKKAKISVVRVDGSTPLPMRQKAVEDFQAGKFTVFLGGLKPCGVGITLTRASKVAFVELDWLPGQMEQAEDRAHRIGQEETVLVFHLVIEGSLDEYMAKRLIEKQEKIGRTLDSQSQYDEDDEDDMDEDDKRDSFAAPDRAASKGITAERLEEEAGRMPEAMLNAAGQAIHFLVEEKLERLNGTDRAIAVAIVEGSFDKKRMALARKIAMRYASLLDTEMVERMKWPKPQTEK